MRDKLRSLIDYNNAVIILVAVFTVGFATYTLLLHYSFKTTGGDLGQYTQMFWTFIYEGKLFVTNYRITEINPTGSYFGEHFSPILFLIAPVFALYPAPETLLIFKAVVQGLAILPLYALAKKLTGSEKIAFIVVLAYSLNPHMLFARIFDFQEQCLIPLLLFLSYLAYTENKMKLFTLTMVLLLMVNEYLPIFVGGYLLALLIREFRASKKGEYGTSHSVSFLKRILSNRKIKFDLALLVVGCVWLYAAHLFIKAFNTMGGTIPPWSVGLEVSGATFVDVVRSVITNPYGFIQAISHDATKKLAGMLAFIAPFLSLPLTKLTFLLPALPYLSFALISTKENYYLFSAHYSFYLAPFAFIALVEALGDMNNDVRSKTSRALILVTIVAFALAALTVAGFGQTPSIDGHTSTLNKIISMVPSNASVLTQNNIFPHLAMRSNSYTCNDPILCTKHYAIKNINQIDYILLDSQARVWKVKWGNVLLPYVMEYIRNGTFGLVAYEDGVILAKKGYTGKPVLFSPPRLELMPSDLIIKNGQLIAGNIVYSGQGVGIIWFGPYVILPPGAYEERVYLTVKAKNPNYIEPIIKLDVVSDKGKTVIAKKYVYFQDVMLGNQTAAITLRFTVDDWIFDAEFRSEALINDVEVVLHKIEIIPLKDEQVPFEMEYLGKELATKCGQVEDIYLVHSPGYCSEFWYGPYIMLNPGNYTAEIWIKIEAHNATDVLMILDVVYNKGKNMIAELKVNTSEIVLGKWTKLMLKFKLQQIITDLEIRCRYIDASAKAYLWRIYVYMAGDNNENRVSSPL